MSASFAGGRKAGRLPMRRGFSVLACIAVVAGYLAVQRPVIAHAVDLPTVSVGDVTMWEGNAGSAVVSVPVDLSAPATVKTTVQVWVHPDTTVGDPASSSVDFGGFADKLTFLAGQTNKLVSVVINGDTTPEPDEHIAVDLNVPVGLTLAKSHGDITIMDDDSGSTGPGITVSLGSFTVVEADAGTHIATIPVTLSQPAATTIKVQYNIDCGTAGPDDYTAQQSGVIAFAAGQQSKSISFTITADTDPETLIKSVVESMTVALGPAVVRATDGEGTIVDNDGSPVGNNPPPTPTTGWPAVGETARASVASDGSEAAVALAHLCDLGAHPARGSEKPAISANGRYVAFQSFSGDLVPGDTNGLWDVFVRDTLTGTTERVSSMPDGSQITSTTVNPWYEGALDPAISADGRYVSFSISAMGAGSGSGSAKYGQIYVRDRVTGALELISATPDGSYSTGGAEWSSISADGRYVAFSSPSTNIVPGGGQGIFLRDRVTHTTQLIDSWPSDCGSVQGDMCGPDVKYMALSGNGRYLAFTSSNSDLVPNDTNNCADTFVRDLVTGTTERVSVASDGSQQVASGFRQCSSYVPYISSDGRYVGFTSTSLTLVPGSVQPDPNELVSHPFIHDRVTGTTTAVDSGDVTANDDMLQGMSDDGRYVTYYCRCGAPLAAVSGVPDDAVVWTDRETGATRVLGEQPNGIQPIDQNTGYFTGTFSFDGLTPDGLHVTFESMATNLVPDDTNNVTDVFIETLG
jgi:hypothetical protein